MPVWFSVRRRGALIHPRATNAWSCHAGFIEGRVVQRELVEDEEGVFFVGSAS